MLRIFLKLICRQVSRCFSAYPKSCKCLEFTLHAKKEGIPYPHGMCNTQFDTRRGFLTRKPRVEIFTSCGQRNSALNDFDDTVAERSGYLALVCMREHSKAPYSVHGLHSFSGLTGPSQAPRSSFPSVVSGDERNDRFWIYAGDPCKHSYAPGRYSSPSLESVSATMSGADNDQVSV